MKSKAIMAICALVAVILIIGALGHIILYCVIGTVIFLVGAGYGRGTAAIEHRRERKGLR